MQFIEILFFYFFLLISNTEYIVLPGLTSPQQQRRPMLQNHGSYPQPYHHQQIPQQYHAPPRPTHRTNGVNNEILPPLMGSVHNPMSDSSTLSVLRNIQHPVTQSPMPSVLSGIPNMGLPSMFMRGSNMAPQPSQGPYVRSLREIITTPPPLTHPYSHPQHPQFVEYDEIDCRECEDQRDDDNEHILSCFIGRNGSF